MSFMAAAFVDTNILIYAVSNAPSERRKSEIARSILREEDVGLSTQVLQEFYWVATRPHKPALTHQEAVAFIEALKRFPLQPISIDVVDDALFLTQRFRISYWDAAILSAARTLDCPVLYSEDLTHHK
jgi:predicted nucleic acid-binding protein